MDAWGFTAHKFITDRAIICCRRRSGRSSSKYRTTVVEHAIDPDTYRTMGFVEEPPRHFLDMDAYGPSPFTELPHDYDAGGCQVRQGLRPQERRAAVARA